MKKKILRAGFKRAMLRGSIFRVFAQQKVGIQSLRQPGLNILYQSLSTEGRDAGAFSRKELSEETKFAMHEERVAIEVN